MRHVVPGTRRELALRNRSGDSLAAVVRWTLAVVGLCAVACGSDGDNNPPFGVPTGASASGSASASASAGSTGEGSSGTSTTGDETGVASTSSGGTTGQATTAPGSTSIGSTSGDETAAVDPGTQPADGLYSTCLVAEECDPIPALCITINDADGNPMDGFCSQTGCTNAAVDCVPTPGGTAVPACMPVTVNDVEDSACALDCSGGATCPSPMTCYSLSFGMICG